jgi:hypothetical protein
MHSKKSVNSGEQESIKVGILRLVEVVTFQEAYFLIFPYFLPLIGFPSFLPLIGNHFIEKQI